MENPLVQLSLNNARVLGGMYCNKNVCELTIPAAHVSHLGVVHY